MTIPRTLATTLLLAASFLVGGCCTAETGAWGVAARAWSKIRPYAEAGVASDARLTQEDRATVLGTFDDFGKLLDEGSREAE